MSVDGGPIRTIPTPLTEAIVQSISPDGQRLLVLDRAGEEAEQALWVIHPQGGEPSRVGSVLCHSAVWSPDGLKIAYAAGSAIYLTAEDGSGIQKIQEVAGVARLLAWSLDGKRLRFELREVNTEQSSLWDLRFNGKDSPDSISASPTPLDITFKQCCQSVCRHWRG